MILRHKLRRNSQSCRENRQSLAGENRVFSQDCKENILRPTLGRLWHDEIYLGRNRRLCQGFQCLILVRPTVEKVQPCLCQVHK